MTDIKDGNGGSGSVDEAMNRVLAAEQEARAAVAACRAEAEAVLARAEVHARRITHRAERRMRAAQRIADNGINRALAALHDDADGAAEAVVAPDQARLDAVVAALVRELTGSPP